MLVRRLGGKRVVDRLLLNVLEFGRSFRYRVEDRSQRNPPYLHELLYWVLGGSRNIIVLLRASRTGRTRNTPVKAPTSQWKLPPPFVAGKRSNTTKSCIPAKTVTIILAVSPRIGPAAPLPPKPLVVENKEDPESHVSALFMVMAAPEIDDTRVSA